MTATEIPWGTGPGQGGEPPADADPVREEWEALERIMQECRLTPAGGPRRGADGRLPDDCAEVIWLAQGDLLAEAQSVVESVQARKHIGSAKHLEARLADLDLELQGVGMFLRALDQHQANDYGEAAAKARRTARKAAATHQVHLSRTRRMVAAWRPKGREGAGGRASGKMVRPLLKFLVRFWSLQDWPKPTTWREGCLSRVGSWLLGRGTDRTLREDDLSWAIEHGWPPPMPKVSEKRSAPQFPVRPGQPPPVPPQRENWRDAARQVLDRAERESAKRKRKRKAQ